MSKLMNAINEQENRDFAAAEIALCEAYLAIKKIAPLQRPVRWDAALDAIAPAVENGNAPNQQIWVEARAEALREEIEQLA